MGLYRSRLTVSTVEQIFKRLHWRYQMADGHIVTGFEGVPMVISVDERREILLLEVPLVPGRGMAGYRPARAQSERDLGIYLGAVNYQLALGSFTRDHHDGEVHYEMSVPVSGGLLSDEQMQQIVEVAVAAVTVRGPTIVALLAGRISLQHALEALDDDQSMPPAMIV